MILTQRIGDSKTHSIPLAWNGRPFAPGGNYTLLWTLKTSPDTQEDSEASVQKASGYGISVTGRKASVSLIPIDTAGGTVEGVTVWPLEPGTYYWDIQAQSISNPEDIRTPASGTLVLMRDVGRGTATAVPVYVVNPGLTYETSILTYT